MRSTTYNKVANFFKVFSGFIIAVPLLIAGAVQAATMYSSGSLLQPGDVTSSHIRDNTIVNVDISTSAAINTTKLGTSATSGNVFYSNGSAVSSSTSFSYNTGANALYVFGGSIHATSTNFGGVNYSWPAANGSANTALLTNGAGTLSWGNPAASAVSVTMTAGDALIAGTPVFIATSTQPTRVWASQLTKDNTMNAGANVAYLQTAESFTETAANRICTVTLFVAKAGTSADNAVVEIQTDNANKPSGYSLATSTRAISGFNTVAQNEVFTFSPCASITPNTKYWVVLSKSGAMDATNNWTFAYKITTDTYANGNRITLNNGTWTADADDLYFSFAKTFTAGSAYATAADSWNEQANFAGISNGTYAVGSSAMVVVAGSVATSTLSVGGSYYLTNTPGGLSTTAGTISKAVCLALSTSACLVKGI